MEPLPRELECPITMEVLEDPVTAPCCGRTFSREALHTWWTSSPRCPMCNGNLSKVNINKLPKNIAMAHMIDEYNRKSRASTAQNGAVAASPAPSAVARPAVQVAPAAPVIPREVTWKAKLHKITGYGRSVIGCLDISPANDSAGSSSQQIPNALSSSAAASSAVTPFKKLVIPVVDESGSMSGSPTTQVRYSLARIVDLVFATPHLMAHVVCYSDQAHSFKIDTTRTVEQNMTYVQRVGRGGGTSFATAFKETLKVCREYQDDPTISSIEILFLTDGEDSSVPANQRQGLVDNFKAALLEARIPNPNLSLTIHSIGFAREHDFEFLDALRIIGSKEGAYRYADPSDGADTLAKKIGSLFHAIASSSAVPLRFESISTPDAKILTNEGSRIWIDLTHAIHTIAPQVTFKIRDRSYTVTAEFAEEENEKDICDAWYSHLTDELSAELLILNQPAPQVAARPASSAQSAAPTSSASSSSSSDVRALHLQLVIRRANALLMRLSADHPAYERLQKVISTCHSIQAGNSADARKLSDMKFEGKFGGPAGASSGPASSSSAVSAISAPPIAAPFKPQGQWLVIDIEDRKEVPRLRILPNSNDGLKVIASSKTVNVVADLQKIADILTVTSTHGLTLLHLASIIGRIPAIQHLLSLSPPAEYLNAKTKPFSKNAPTFTAADLALLFGRWHSFEILVAAGATISIAPELLLQTCLSNGYYNSAKALLKHRKVDIEAPFIARAPTSEIATWLGQNSSTRVSLATAINQGMFDEVNKRLRVLKAGKPEDEDDASFTFSFAQFPALLEKTTDSNLQVLELLFELKFADPEEVFPAPGDDEGEITWPLFVAAQSGNMAIFQLVLSQSSAPSYLNRQNNKGTTALWIASCNRHIDIVYALLSQGADPNICNHKGDGPLIPACQKGSQNIVEALLGSGASLESFNKNRDNPILICCRTGQAKILKIFLEHIESPAKRAQLLEEYAEIDGFDPIHASAELDRVECIKVCVAMGAAIESRSKPDNPIIGGATALHLAAFYGRSASVAALIELGADPLALTEIPAGVKSTTTPGSTALHLAVKQGHANVVRLLLGIPAVKASLNTVLDGDGHLASYYAQSEANASLYEEFFVNHLSPVLNSILFSEPSAATADLEASTLTVLRNYSQSLGVYSHADFLSDASAGGDAPLITSALLTGRFELASGLMTLGADMKRPDAHGITPEFWAHFLGFNLPSRSQVQISLPSDASSSAPSSISAATSSSSSAPAHVPAYVQAMLDRLSKASKRSLQNKLLLTAPQLGANKKLIAGGGASTAAPGFDIVLKMIDGYKTSVKPRVVEELRGYASRKSVVEESLVGLTDKLKSSRKLFPEGEDTMDALIWEAKIHLIRTIASSPESDEAALDPVNYLAIFLYTAHPDIFSKVNLTLADWQSQKAVSKADAQLVSMWKQFVQCLYRSLDKLPFYEGELYRTVPGAFDPREYSIGSTVSWNSFSVTTRSWNNLTNWTNESPKADPKTKRGVIFIIQSKTARRIEKLSRFPIEAEAIILPGTQFVVKNLYVASIIAFGQANIRTSTYLAKENDLNKAAAGETSIIVELEEVTSPASASSPAVDELN